MFSWRLPFLGLVAACLLWVTCLVGSCQPATEAPRAASSGTTEADQVLGELSDDIDLLYTVNRLDLQPAQLTPLLGLVEQVRAEKTKLEPQRQAAIAALVPLLREKRALLLQDKEPSEELDGKITAAQTKLDEVEESLSQASGKYVPDLKKLLSKPQIQIITGADEARSQVEELLQWLRELPAADYPDEAKSNAEALAEPELNLNAAAILKIFDEARKYSAADFTKHEESLVDRLVPLYMPAEEAADDTLVQFFSSPRLGVILQERGGK